MKKISFFIVACIVLIACKNKVAVPQTSQTDIVNMSEQEEYDAINKAEKELKDSINSLQYNLDENGFCEGLPEKYESKNKEEEKLSSSLDNYFEAALSNDVSKARLYICPKVISLAKEKFPQSSDEEIEEAVLSGLAKFSELKEYMKTHFEGVKKTAPLITQLYKLPSKKGCLLYSVHYSLVILCTADDQNYYAWHLPMFMYAASYDDGKNWYFVELVEDTNEVLNDFR